MAKYRKKPAVIEAEQLTERTEVKTLEGTMVGNPGDWLITGVKGEQYPCKDDIFRETYEPVEFGKADEVLVELERIGWPCELRKLPQLYDETARELAATKQRVEAARQMLRKMGFTPQSEAIMDVLSGD